MAVKKTDNKEHRGWRKFVSKNFGQDYLGRSYASNLFNSYVAKHTPLQPRNMKSAEDKVMSGLVTAMIAAGGTLVISLGGAVYNDSSDAALLDHQTEMTSADILEGPEDESGVIMTYSQKEGSLMLRREGDNYQLYQYADRHDNDYALRLIMDADEAARLSSVMIRELDASIQFPDIAGFRGNTYDFAGISGYYSIEGEEGVFRALDERVQHDQEEIWSQEDLKATFEDAQAYFAQGLNFGNYVGIDIEDEHLLNGALDKDGDYLKLILGAWGIYSGLGLGVSALQASAASRRRFRREGKPFSFDL
jgi:hypothetical protein